MHTILLKWYKRYFSDPEAVGIVVAIVLSILAIKLIGGVLVLVVISAIISYMLSVMVKKLEYWNAPHLLAVITVFTIFVAVLLFVLFWLLPLLGQQLFALFTEVPRILKEWQAFLLELHARYPQVVSALHIEHFIGEISNNIAVFSRVVLTLSLASIKSVTTGAAYLILVPLLVFFFLRDESAISIWLQQFLPKNRLAMQLVWRDVHAKIGRYICGKIVEMLIVAAISMFTFAVMGLHYAFLLGALVGVSVFIPYAGVVAITIPIFIVAVFQWGMNGYFCYFMLVYAVIIILDANVLVPVLFAEAMDLHPMAIILSVLLFGELAGFWGVFFAIPLMTLVNALVKVWPKVDENTTP